MKQHTHASYFYYSTIHHLTRNKFLNYVVQLEVLSDMMAFPNASLSRMIEMVHCKRQNACPKLLNGRHSKKTIQFYERLAYT